MIGFTNLLPGVLRQKDLVTNFLATIKGKPLDATMGKQLKDELNALNSDLTADGEKFRYGKTADGQRGYIITDEAGADTVIPFRYLTPITLVMNGSGATTNYTYSILNFSSPKGYKQLSYSADYSVEHLQIVINGLTIIDTHERSTKGVIVLDPQQENEVTINAQQRYTLKIMATMILS